MRFNKDNTEFMAFYVGISKDELAELERLIVSFKKHFSDMKLTVLDMSKASYEAIQKGEKLWQQDRAFTVDIEPTAKPSDTDEILEKYKDTVNRIEAEYYQARAYRTNKSLYEYASKPYVLLLDSDIEFKNGDFFTDASEMSSDMPEDDFGVLCYISTALGFGVDKKIFGSRKSDLSVIMLRILDKATSWLSRRRAAKSGGFANHDERGQRFKGTFPRLNPEFVLLNRKRFIECGMTFDILYLDVDDFSEGPRREWRIIGDEGAGMIFQMAKHQLGIVNVNYEQWAEHKLGSWARLKKKNVNWYYIGRDYEGTDRAYWRQNSMPDEMIYKPKK